MALIKCLHINTWVHSGFTPGSEKTANKKCRFTERVTLRSFSKVRVAIVTHIMHMLAAVAFHSTNDVFNTLIHYTCTCKPSAALISTFREAIRHDLAYNTHIKTQLQSTPQ